jgi:hypothetical protein
MAAAIERAATRETALTFTVAAAPVLYLFSAVDHGVQWASHPIH